DIAETLVREITPQVSKTETQLALAIFNALPTDSRPPGLSLDTALDAYTYALWNIGDGASPLGLLNDDMVSALGWMYGRGDGTVRYENRHARALASSQYTLTDNEQDTLLVPNTLAGVYNRVRASIHKLRVATSTVLFAATGSFAVAPGDTVT